MSGTGIQLYLPMVVLLLVVMLRRGGPSIPPVPPAPGGPDQLGTFQGSTGQSPAMLVQATSYASASDWNSSSPFDTRRPLSPEQAEELGKLDSLRSTGTLTEDAYLQARARLFGIGGNTGWSVAVLSSGGNKIKAIKAVRVCRRDLGLKGAKDFVDALPQVLFKGLQEADAERVKQQCEQAGVSVRLQKD